MNVQSMTAATLLLMLCFQPGCVSEMEVEPGPGGEDILPDDTEGPLQGSSASSEDSLPVGERPLVHTADDPACVAACEELQDKQGGSPGEPAAQIYFVSPGAKCSNPVTLTVSTSKGINHVRYLVDGKVLGISEDRPSGFPLVHNFWGTGTRQLEARGYNVDDVQIAVTKQVTLIEEEQVKTPAAEIAFLTPTGGPVWGPVTFTVSTVGPINFVEYWIDGNSKFGASTTKSGGFPVTWQPWTTGERIVTAKGYVAGELFDQDSISILVQTPDPAKEKCPAGQTEDCNGLCANSSWLDDGICDNGSAYAADFYCEAFAFDGGDCTQKPAAPSAGGVPDVPYFYQNSNSLSPGSSCQNTSLAMLLAWYGWGGNPDTITSAWGKDYAQSPSGLAAVFNTYAQSMGIPQRLVAHTNGTISGMKSLLAKGLPVIVHGYFTGYGHIMVTLAYGNGSYIVNDPAGEWSQSFKGGYPYGWNSTIGDHISYGASAFEKAIATWDGYAAAPLWYHEITE